MGPSQISHARKLLEVSYWEYARDDGQGRAHSGERINQSRIRLNIEEELRCGEGSSMCLLAEQGLNIGGQVSVRSGMPIRKGRHTYGEVAACTGEIYQLVSMIESAIGGNPPSARAPAWITAQRQNR